MTERIILDICHSDDYTDYLFQTAVLRNNRIIPLVDPSKEELKRLAGGNTLVVHCDNFRREADKEGNLSTYEYLTDTIHVFSKSYLSDDGAIDYAKAELARTEIEEHLKYCLTGPYNQQEAFRERFPLLWNKRRIIYETPNLFYAEYINGDCGYPFGSIVYLGAILKAIETHSQYFRYNPPGGCHCEDGPIIIDYKKTFKELGEWVIYTWCPSCDTRASVKMGDNPKFYTWDRVIKKTDEHYVTGVGFSALTILDVIDSLKEA